MTEEESKIGGVEISAPIWNNATFDELTAIVKDISAASYNYADDSYEEWGIADDRVKSAAKKINRLKLGYFAIGYLMRDKFQLVSPEQLFDAVLKDLRSETGVSEPVAYRVHLPDDDLLRQAIEALRRADEELRMIRMKDTSSVYDTLIRIDIAAILAAYDAKGGA